MRLRLIALLAALVVGATAATAQGGGPTLTAGQYRAKANAICGDLSTYYPPAGTLVAQFGAVLTRAHAELRALRKLKPPARLAATHRQVTVLIAGGLDTFDSLLAKLRSGKLTAIQFHDAVARVSSTKEDALWTKLGAKVCAQS